MALGYPNGIRKKEIPYEAQIVRVADEYDAIVSKRQYKSHIGVSDTLKILIGQTIKNKNSKFGKVDPKIVKCLIKVVIDDTLYEITHVEEYLNFLETELKRFNQIENYKNKILKSKKEKTKNYYLEGIKILLKENETLENYSKIYDEYKNAYSLRKIILNNLYNELKIIKKLKV